MNIRFIGASQISEYMKDDRIVFVDLREHAQYRKKHIRGAVSMPYEVFLEKHITLSRKKVYVLYCERGATSIMAASKMLKSGYKCYSLAGGMNALQ